eukprot:TRINITY_DN4326_c0_g1_i1.p1 TRINITY_DN4326_c0_g1~~TRINITY_DN4326_c0_g1_i1.p1  ORF type:complete len:521 (-),score=68.12 TRINITY_DN4326_c0_g1_i1:425-1987(-)
MGKPENNADVSQQNQQQEENQCNCDASRVCNRSTLKRIVAVIVSINVFLIGLYSFPFLRNANGRGGHGSQNNTTVQVQASFMLPSPVSLIKEHVPELEWEIWEEIGARDTKVKIISLSNLTESNGTEVAFGIVPSEGIPAISSVSLSLMREVFMVLVLGQYNLSLNSSDIFGRASNFQVLAFPGGITIVPEQNRYPLERKEVLFNFTLHYSIEQVLKNLGQLKEQLQNGLNISSNENLFVQLTNSKGSTVELPTVIETSIVPVVGGPLPPPRLKQLAQEITKKHPENLGLNHTLFGKVKEINLSSYLKDPLSPPPLPSPAPSPLQPVSSPASSPIPYAPSPLQAPQIPYYYGPPPDIPHGHCHHRHHHHHRHPVHKCKHHSNHVPFLGSPVPSPSRTLSPDSSPYSRHQHPVASPAPSMHSTLSPHPSSSKGFPFHPSLSPVPSVSPRFRSKPPAYHRDSNRAPLASNTHRFAPSPHPYSSPPSEHGELHMTSASFYTIAPYSLFKCFIAIAGAQLVYVL